LFEAKYLHCQASGALMPGFAGTTGVGGAAVSHHFPGAQVGNSSEAGKRNSQQK
jgi:hypothetical protein